MGPRAGLKAVERRKILHISDVKIILYRLAKN
jgi:hypothetical protein